MKKRKWFIKVEFKKQDLWIGVFWKTLCSIAYEIDPRFPVKKARSAGPGKARFYDYQITHLDVWVCLLPMLPIHFGWRRP